MTANTLPEVLTYYLYAELFTVTELADAADRAEKTIYGYADGKRCPFDVAKRIARYCSRRGHNELADLLLNAEYEVCPRGEARANGVIDDEATDFQSLMGALIDAQREGDRDKMSELIGKGEELWDRVKAERDRL